MNDEWAIAWKLGTCAVISDGVSSLLHQLQTWF